MDDVNQPMPETPVEETTPAPEPEKTEEQAA